MKLSDFDHFRSNPMIKFKEELVEGISYTIVSYMIGDNDLWSQPMALETRGNTFETESGKWVSGTFPKFFNVGEREDTQIDLIKNQFVECYEKRDGSMLSAILTKSGEIKFKTKKSFYSDVAELANQIAPENVITITRNLLKNGLSPIWEFTHPDWKIVIDYDPKDNFTLLSVRNLNSGNFYSYDQCKRIESVRLIPKINYSIEQIQNSIQKDTGIEGYVLLLDNGRRVKFKTQWYLSLHRVMTDIRERDIAEAVILETIDDIKSLVSSQGQDIEPIIKIETSVAEELAHIRNEVEHLVSQSKHFSIKENAISFKNHHYFSLIMTALREKEPKYKEYWVRNYLKNYSLRGIFNKNF